MTLSLPLMNSAPQSDWRDLPPIVSEALVSKFVYWNQQLQSGMRYGSNIYTLLDSYPITERLKACDVACKYTAQGIEVCITASNTMYSVWLNLRSLSSPLEPLCNSKSL